MRLELSLPANSYSMTPKEEGRASVMFPLDFSCQGTKGCGTVFKISGWIVSLAVLVLWIKDSASRDVTPAPVTAAFLRAPD